MRLLIVGIVACLVPVNLFGSRPAYSAAHPARFAEHTIATDLRGGYQVVVADLNHDGKLDLIAVASGMKELIWFENPGWQRHVIVGNISSPINCAAWDIDGDGIPEIALAHEFSNDPAKSIGIVSLLKHKGDPSQPWEMIEIDRLPTSHRLRWLDMDGNGKKVLVNAPLAGAHATLPDYKGAVPVVFYRPGTWKREIISQELEGVLHAILVTDWNADGKEDLLTAGFLGVDLFSYGKNKHWARTRILPGNPDPWPRSGSSEIAVGKVGRDRFLCTIEPWHGNQVVVYHQQGKDWKREVIDTSLNDGHVLLTADLNRDGRDEIIGGYRGQGRSVYIYSAEDSAGARWSRQTLDDGGMSAAGCAVADLNGDGRPDVACIGTATTNLKWYENLGASNRAK
ncbi:MAG TPA: VCBS repeat-containing protein [Blastocatellia bacterium]|nr:VCBS repeat-containing protein [Blastocatellia bacterium]